MRENNTPHFEHDPATTSEPIAAPDTAPQEEIGEKRKVASAEMTPEEQEQKEQLRQTMVQSLSTLYELLPRQGTIEAKQIEQSIPLTESKLVELTPLMKHTLTRIIEEKQLHLKSKEEFVSVGLVVLDLWMHLQALGDAATEWLSQFRAEPKPPDQTGR